MRALLIQPPFVQLNSPYPAIHFLEAFLRENGVGSESFDHSIDLYRAIFSREGITRIFKDAGESPILHDPPDEESRRQLARYMSYRDLYIEWIDGIVDFLSGGDPSFAHRLAQAAEFPRGRRCQAFLDSAGGRIGPDDARALATRVLDDLGDFIAFTLDPEFATVRYGEQLARSAPDFHAVEAALDGAYLMRRFYGPRLRSFFSAGGAAVKHGRPDLLLVSIPFAGCLPGALVAAREARAALGGETRILFGGGFVSTELRSLSDGHLFDYCDYLCFDAGYGSLASILAVEAGEGREALYRTMYRDGTGRVRASGFPPGAGGADTGDGAAAPGGEPGRFRQAEERALETVFPDYRSVDFNRYLRVVDSANPMHRLWSDTPWLKYRLAHGCYWGKCSFCDTELEYVKDYAPADLAALLTAVDAASLRSGIRGVHFVDEAMPMSRLLGFAVANRERAAAGIPPYSFWGNVRFDSSWSADRCELLAASGLVAVSGGIEIATEAGLEMTAKGFDFPGLVKTLTAMKRAGLLVHAYLIYGFPGQKPPDIVDSAEAVRQLFAAGLIDSAFWHRFILGRHSRMFREWRTGGQARLRPIDHAGSSADNDLGFVGEERFDRYSDPLEDALAAWMEGEELDRPAVSWFEGTGLGSTLAPDHVETLIARAEEALTAAAPPLDRGRPAFWVAGLPRVEVRGKKDGSSRLAWTCRGAEQEVRLPEPAARDLARIIERLARTPRGIPYAAIVSEAGEHAEALVKLRGAGLVIA
jgi:radical SAM superfamily enzyme YgiQ (UPF0313 family)